MHRLVNWHPYGLYVRLPSGSISQYIKNATLKEPIYMKQPQGYIQKGDNYVLKLKKAMYGLKQSSRAWYKCLSLALMKLGFQKSNSDAAVFYRHGGKGFVIIAVTVDDLTITTPQYAHCACFSTPVDSHTCMTFAPSYLHQISSMSPCHPFFVSTPWVLQPHSARPPLLLWSGLYQ